jgi:hypothetical protein
LPRVQPSQLPLVLDAAGVTALRVREPSERLRAAADEHDRLLARVTRRRTARDRLEQDVRAAVTNLEGRIAPLIEEGRRLDEQLHAMLEGLVNDGARPRRERDEIARLYRELQDGGILSPRGHWADLDATVDGHAPPPASDAPGDAAPPSAKRPQEGDRGVLRGLFRRLAEALHPDKVQDEHDKAHRTEVMKQVTVAYHDGDFARLLEIERAWAVSGAAVATDDDGEVERRVAAIDRANDALRGQLRAIEREIRALRRSEGGRLATDLRRRGGDGPAVGVTSGFERELAALRAMCDFVRRFRDGEMSLAAFLDGPGAEDDLDDLDVAEVLAALVMLAQDEAVGAGPTRNRRRGKAPGSKPRRRSR